MNSAKSKMSFSRIRLHQLPSPLGYVRSQLRAPSLVQYYLTAVSILIVEIRLRAVTCLPRVSVVTQRRRSLAFWTRRQLGCACDVESTA